ncbi:MAG: helix-turn-helix transcriptional regulator [Clostridia bacterium]|nr:helix-turn-helix transcriptional regulator [Clostridia bacterium]
MNNTELRSFMKSHGIRQWEVAEEIGISECTLSHWFRRELAEDKQALVVTAVNTLILKMQGGNKRE